MTSNFRFYDNSKITKRILLLILILILFLVFFSLLGLGNFSIPRARYAVLNTRNKGGAIRKADRRVQKYSH